jgi:transcriptional regulator with XRE-family HTH domain
MQIRNQQGITQRELSQRSGIAGSYLSRIENRRVEPRPKTLRRLAEALGVPVAEFFQDRDVTLSGVQCAMTASGRCLMDMIRASHGKPLQPGAEAYTPRHLQLLRLAGYLIQTGDARLLDAMEVLLGGLLNSGQSRLDHLSSTLLRPNPEPVPR